MNGEEIDLGWWVLGEEGGLRALACEGRLPEITHTVRNFLWTIFRVCQRRQGPSDRVREIEIRRLIRK